MHRHGAVPNQAISREVQQCFLAHFLLSDTNGYLEVFSALRVHAYTCLGPISLISTQMQLMLPGSQPQ